MGHLLVIEAKGAKHVVCPSFSGTAVGEYPTGYFGLSGLNLTTKKVMPLPPPLSSVWEADSRCIVDVSGTDAVHREDVTFSGLAAQIMRARLIEKNDEERKQYFREGLKEDGSGNELVSYAINGLEKTGQPLDVSLEFRNSSSATPAGKSTYYKLTDFFGEHLRDVDTSWTDPFFLPYRLHFLETVEYKTAPGKKAVEDIKCTDINSSLMTVRCLRMHGGKIQRDVVLHPVRFPRDSLIAHFAEIRRLNSIRESSVVVK